MYFDDLEKEAAKERAELSVSEGMTQETAQAYEDLMAETGRRNLEQLSTLGANIEALGVDELLEEAQSLVKLHPDLEESVWFNWKRFDWVPRTRDMRMIRASLDELDTSDELKAISGYTLFMTPKTIDADTQQRFRWSEDRRRHVNDRGVVKTASVLYVLAYVTGDKDRDEEPRLVVATERLEEDDDRDVSTEPLWELLSEEHRRITSAIARQGAAELLGRAIKLRRDGTIEAGPPIKKPEYPKIMVTGKQSLEELNRLFEEPRTVGRWLFKRTVGGHYAKLSEALVTTDRATIETHRTHIAEAVEDWLQRNPFEHAES